MNYKMVLFTMGRVVLLEAALLVLPMAVSLLYGEKCALSFALTILVALAVGFLLTKLCRGEHGSSSIKDGFMIVALTWIMLSARCHLYSPGRSRSMWMRFLRRSAALPPPAPRSCPMWRL